MTVGDAGRARPDERRKILLAIDDSWFSEAATQFLSTHYKAAETDVLVLHATDSRAEMALSCSQAPAPDSEGLRKMESLVSRVAHTLSQTGFKVTTQIEAGEPRSRIVDSARAWAADLIVVGSHGRTGLDRLLLGSVSEAVARMAPCSVAIVRMQNGAKQPELPKGMRETTGAKILLAIDDSRRFSEAATQAIVQQMRPEQTEVCILHVIEPLFFSTDAGQYLLLEKGRELVMRSGQVLGQAGFQVKTAVEDGDPRTAIVDYAAHYEADLIVVGCHGRKGMDRFLIGSVSENIARHSHCSVEIVRPPAAQAP